MPVPNRDRHYVAGKGAWRRPEDAEAYRANFDRIFARKTCETCRHGCNNWCFKLLHVLDSLNPICGGSEYLEA